MEEEHVDAPFDQYEARTGADRLKNNIGDNEADVIALGQVDLVIFLATQKPWGMR